LFEIPILANITEFGQTPLFNRDELHANGVSIVLYPLSAHRAMMKAAESVYLFFSSFAFDARSKGQRIFFLIYSSHCMISPDFD
jgi:hypothetical protein